MRLPAQSFPELKKISVATPQGQSRGPVIANDLWQKSGTHYLCHFTSNLTDIVMMLCIWLCPAGNWDK